MRLQRRRKLQNILAALKEADAIQEAEREKANLSEAGRAFFGGKVVL